MAERTRAAHEAARERERAEKKAYVEGPLKRLLFAADFGLADVEYIAGRGYEDVVLTYKNGHVETVNVHLDSKKALFIDVARHLRAL